MMLAFHSDFSPLESRVSLVRFRLFDFCRKALPYLSKSFTIFVKKLYYIYGKALAHLSKI